MHKNIVFIGFMASGKTTIAKSVAAVLNKQFIDVDQYIEKKQQLTVKQIFDKYGEFYYRQKENNFIKQLFKNNDQIIALGGGSILLEDNCDLIFDHDKNIVIYLQTDVEQILNRCKKDFTRPLLSCKKGEDKKQKIANIYRQRSDIYDKAFYKIDTTNLSIDEVVEEVKTILQNENVLAKYDKVWVKTDKHYPIIIGENCLKDLAFALLCGNIVPGPVSIIIDQSVADIYQNKIKKILTDKNYQANFITLPSGENQKNISNIEKIYDNLMGAGATKDRPIISIGGGVVGDIGGFIASTYLRGVPFINVPTSLLAMVDSCVGGKNGFNLSAGKNLVGSFKHPKIIIIDTNFLTTLPDEELNNGMAEALKHALINNDDKLFELISLEKIDFPLLIKKALRVKIDIIERDPYEKNERMLLNLGHTFAHAIEKTSNYKIKHGYAVAVGLVMACCLGENLHLTSPEVTNKVKNILKKLQLPISLEGYSAEEIFNAMNNDKKNSYKQKRFIVPLDIGRSKIINNPGNEHVKNALFSNCH